MEWVLFAHIALGTLWLGGVMYQESLVVMAKKESREAYVRTAVRAGLTNARIYPPVTILLMGTAAWMIFAQDYLSWGDAWIIIAATLWLLSVVTGIAYFTPKANELAVRLEDEGPSAEVEEAVDRMNFVARAEIIPLLLILVMMVTKPGA